MIELKHVSKKYVTPSYTKNIFSRFMNPSKKITPAIQDISLTIKQGEFIGILGKNGSGKTTFLKLICGLLTPDTGKILINKKDPLLSKHLLGVCFGKKLIYKRITGYENLEYYHNLYTSKNPRKIDELIKLFDMKSYIRNYVETYSEGMLARLAIARALLHDPEILILDEPFSSLDPESKQEILNIIASSHKTVLFVTHIPEDLHTYADRILTFQKGKIIENDS